MRTTREIARSRRLLALAWVLVLAWPALLSGQKAAKPEAEVKADFLKAFISMTDWPTNTFAEANAPVVLGVLGADPILAPLRANPALPNGRPLRIKELASVEAAQGCHVLFVATASAKSLADVAARLGDAPVLTVVELPAAARNEGVIHLRKEMENEVMKFRYDVNNAAAQRIKLKLNSKLLRLAKTIY
ncbi:MAG: YfiR family protein [Verrucomicrobia bacterium]|nr:YfiR family protein [Verrucomicrobiota bacterium]